MTDVSYTWLDAAITDATNFFGTLGMEFLWLANDPAHVSDIQALRNQAKINIDESFYDLLHLSNGVEIRYGDPKAPFKEASDSYRIIPIFGVSALLAEKLSLRDAFLEIELETAWEPFWPLIDLQDSSYLASTRSLGQVGSNVLLPIDIHTGPDDWLLRKSTHTTFEALLRGFFQNLPLRSFEPGLDFLIDYFREQLT